MSTIPRARLVPILALAVAGLATLSLAVLARADGGHAHAGHASAKGTSAASGTPHDPTEGGDHSMMGGDRSMMGGDHSMMNGDDSMMSGNQPMMGGDMMAAMSEQCRRMAAMHDEMMAAERAEDTRLEELVAQMRTAPKSHRLDATQMLLEELVSSREQQQQRMDRMAPMMMRHAMAHGMAGMMQGGSSCPMMAGPQGADEPSKPVDHAAHHQ